jgi:hypothetical protein
MTIKSRHLALVAVAVSAVAPAGALATVDGSRTVAKQHCGKDYSRNSVSGDYCEPASSAIPVTAPTSPAPAAPIVVTHDAGFSWGDAGVGAGGAIALIGVTAGGAIAFRRRQTPGKPVTG